MEKFSIREVVSQAIQTEKLGYQFYTSMAEKFKKDNEGMNKLFTTLAEKELIHEKTFSDLLPMIGDVEPEGWEDISQYMRAIVESEFFLGKNKSLPSMENIKTVKDAVDFAIGFEKETLLYFYGIKDAVKEKEIVEEIINEEKSHIRWLISFKSTFVK
ncbi:rubrerythrin [Dissulfurispira thermophila]|uniref:Rubrerythrin n=1 Tax=Dissulfurispira thermophila TaxID=2715679 RepID=A0A7G1H1G0_9BACT|nr:ferritin family protein [Dissulfurispira thermophila]BCB96624.1 rubrerythrin [Dissulfurispira thermophila]